MKVPQSTIAVVGRNLAVGLIVFCLTASLLIGGGDHENMVIHASAEVNKDASGNVAAANERILNLRLHQVN